MNWKELLFGAPKAAPAPEVKSVVTYPPHLFWDSAGRPLAGATSQPFDAYATFALAYACMGFRATKTAEPRLWLAKETDDGDEWLTTHELDGLLQEPNPDMDMADLLELTSLYLDATGACLWHKTRDGAGRVGRLYPYSDDEFTVREGDGRLYGRFTIQSSGGTRYDLPASEVIYFRQPDPRDLHSGLGPLEAALAHVHIGQDMRRAITSALRNAIRPGAIVQTVGDAPLTDAEYERLKTQISAQYAGVLNDGKSMLVERATFELIEHSLKKLELGPMQSDVEVAVCQAFKIHPGLVGTRIGLEHAGGMSDSIAPSLDLYYDVAQKPIWSRIERALTRQLLREVDPDLTVRVKFDLSQISALQDDVMQRATEAATAGKFWTVDEGRAHTGQQPIGDERGEAFIEAMPAPVDPNDPEADADEAMTDDEKQSKSVASVMVHRLMEDAVRESEEAMLEVLAYNELKQDEVALHRVFGLHTKDHTPDHEIQELLRNAEAVLERALTSDEAEALLANAEKVLEAARGRWSVAMRAPLEVIAGKATSRAAGSVGATFAQLQPGLPEFVDRETGFLITSVTETTRDTVRKAIKDGLEAGDGIRVIAKRVEDAGSFSRDRAKLIATTEVTRARNGAALEQMQSYASRTGLTVTKTWINSADGRVRTQHRNQPTGVGGEQRKINQPFSNGLDAPSEPNCRCSLLYGVE